MTKNINIPVKLKQELMTEGEKMTASHFSNRSLCNGGVASRLQHTTRTGGFLNGICCILSDKSHGKKDYV